MRIVLVSSIGGHLSELCTLIEELEGHEFVWVLNDSSPVLPEGVTAFRVAHGERDWRVVWNLFEFAAIFSRERPDMMLSMGAGPAVPAALIARLAGIPVVYVEPSSAVRDLTLTGRFMRMLANSYFVQWSELLKKAPRARHAGSLL